MGCWPGLTVDIKEVAVKVVLFLIIVGGIGSCIIAEGSIDAI